MGDNGLPHLLQFRVLLHHGLVHGGTQISKARLDRLSTHGPNVHSENPARTVKEGLEATSFYFDLHDISIRRCLQHQGCSVQFNCIDSQMWLSKENR